MLERSRQPIYRALDVMEVFVHVHFYPVHKPNQRAFRRMRFQVLNLLDVDGDFLSITVEGRHFGHPALPFLAQVPSMVARRVNAKNGGRGLPKNKGQALLGVPALAR